MCNQPGKSHRKDDASFARSIASSILMNGRHSIFRTANVTHSTSLSGIIAVRGEIDKRKSHKYFLPHAFAGEFSLTKTLSKNRASHSADHSTSGGKPTRGQYFNSGHSVHFGRRAIQMRRPWWIRRCEYMIHSCLGSSSQSSRSMISGFTLSVKPSRLLIRLT